MTKRQPETLECCHFEIPPYKDNNGQTKYVYSWRLDKNDRTPTGKKRELSLREKEKQIEHDLFDGIAINGGNYTLLELVKKYVSLKTGVRHNTAANYNFVIMGHSDISVTLNTYSHVAFEDAAAELRRVAGE